MDKGKIRVLIVDDSALMRRVLEKELKLDRSIEIVGVARDGEDAISKAVECKPDVITLDINMPKMDGLTALQHIMTVAPCPVIIVSSLSHKGALVTFEALELGAFDYVAKPDGTVSSELKKIMPSLIEKIKEATRTKDRTKRRNPISFTRKKLNEQQLPKVTSPLKTSYDHVVVIGVSTGGPNTLMEILPHFPADFPAPILVIQHMPPKFTSSFAERLNKQLPMKVTEAKNLEVFEPGVIYIAPGGKHLYVERKLGTRLLRAVVKEQPIEAYYKPSVDITMLSVAKHFPPEKIIAVLLTGIGDDGANGMVQIKRENGLTIAESEETAVVYGMPKAAKERGGASYVLASYDIATVILQEVMK